MVCAWAPFAGYAVAAPVPPKQTLPSAKPPASLEMIHRRVLAAQKELLQSDQDQKAAQQKVQRIRELLALQKQEMELVQAKTARLESYILELETRRNQVLEKIGEKQTAIRGFLVDLSRSRRREPKALPASPDFAEEARREAPYRRALAGLVDIHVSELESLRADLSDAEGLQNRIQEERQQLANLSHDLQEQQGLLKFHRELQLETIRTKYSERIAQLRSYHRLKESEAQVEGLMSQFNARVEFERVAEAERAISRDMHGGEFVKAKGKLPLPLAGRVLTGFGRVVDAQSKLTVFKKGVDIEAAPKSSVKAIFSGKVVFAGKLPGYDNVVILDHGDHYYSLCGRLGEMKRQVGDVIAQGDELGIADGNGQPIYFEVRARNVAVNPLQWVRI